MEDILTDCSAPAVNNAIRANLFSWWRYLGSSPAATFFEDSKAMCLATGIAEPFVNPLLLAGARPAEIQKVIAKASACFRSKEIVRFSCWIDEVSEILGLDAALTDNGMTRTEGGPGMAVNLPELVEDAAIPKGLTIGRVENRTTLKQWAYTSIIGSGLPDTSVDACYKLFTGLGFDGPLVSYLGLLDGMPIASSQLFLGAGVAGVYIVATLPKARRQGIGAAMTLVPLRNARDMGYQVGILHASPMGESIYRRLGFNEYCRMSHYTHN